MSKISKTSASIGRISTMRMRMRTKKRKRPGRKPQPSSPSATTRAGAEVARNTRSAIWQRMKSRRAGIAEANRLYFDQPVEEVDPEEASTSGFFEWYVYDYRSSRNGRTLVEEYLRRYGPRLGARERELLESWRAARFGLF